MNIEEFQSGLSEAIGPGDTPVVVFSAAWPLLRAIDLDRREAPGKILQALINVVGSDRSLFMPTFSRGLVDGFADLDEDPSGAGMLTEQFRLMDQTRRTVCPWFSFAVQGPDRDEVVALRPQHAWGPGSVFEWMEQKNATFVMLGTDPSHCSYLHRIEWLERDVVLCRFEKDFRGRVRHEGHEFDIAQTLFVRHLDPEVVNDYAPANEALIGGGMTVSRVGGVSVAVMSAADMLNAFSKALRDDPLIAVQNRDEVEAAFYHKD